MSHRVFPIIVRTAAACALCASAFVFAAPVQAQPYGQADEDYGPSAGAITVTPPYHREWNSETRRFVDRAYASRVVDVSDLDLRTSYGIRELRMRVRDAARDVCDELSDRYGDDPDQDRQCYVGAVRNALDSVPEYVDFRE